MSQRVPDFKGNHGRHWKAWLSKVARTTEKERVILDSYLLYCPGAHPFWSYYHLSTCHLRECPGFPTANKTSENNTHEIMILVVHPDEQYPDPDRQSYQTMQPANLSVQIEVPQDDAARAIMKRMVQMIMTGHYSPDSDWRRTWFTVLQKMAGEYRRN